MVVQTAAEAKANANRYRTCEQGKCLAYVRTWLEIGSRDFSAAEAWRQAEHKHPGDRTPPAGAPVFWLGGSKGYGHIGLMMDFDSHKFRGTDMPGSGQVSTQNLTWVERYWGRSQNYAGWSEDLNGIWIPYLKAGGDVEDWRASGDVYVEMLKKGQDNSQSVSRLRWRLQHHKQIPDNRRPGLGSPSKKGAKYTADVVSASKYWMQQVWPDSKGTGENWTNKQANALFGPNYNVIEEKP